MSKMMAYCLFLLFIVGPFYLFYRLSTRGTRKKIENMPDAQYHDFDSTKKWLVTGDRSAELADLKRRFNATSWTQRVQSGSGLMSCKVSLADHYCTARFGVGLGKERTHQQALFVLDDEFTRNEWRFV